MAKENTREQKLKYAFGAHPSVKEFHVASDDSMFLNASDAKNHAATLDDKEVKVEKRSDYIVKTEQPSNKDSEADKAKSERATLFAKHEKLFGQKPASNAPTKMLKEKIATEEARLAEAATKDAEALASGAGAEGGSEGASGAEPGADGGAGDGAAGAE